MVIFGCICSLDGWILYIEDWDLFSLFIVDYIWSIVYDIFIDGTKFSRYSRSVHRNPQPLRLLHLQWKIIKENTKTSHISLIFTYCIHLYHLLISKETVINHYLTRYVWKCHISKQFYKDHGCSCTVIFFSQKSAVLEKWPGWLNSHLIIFTELKGPPSWLGSLAPW